MSRKHVVILVGVVCFLSMSVVANAGGVFVATAKNLRGALYLGVGPTPVHASELAIVKCSQDSFVPATCKVVAMRKEIVPKRLKKMRKPIRKSRRPYAGSSQKSRYSWGRPMP
jgi:hypothetical protein